MTFDQRVAAARAEVAAAFSEFDHVVIQFSGGKDSIIVADLAEPWRDRASLVWVNTGDGPLGMAEFVRGYQERWRYVEIPANPRASWVDRGPPADIASAQSALVAGPGAKVQPWPDCCARNRGQPLRKFLVELAVRLLVENRMKVATLHGQREDDHAFTLEEQAVYSGLPKPFAPLWSWSETDVMSYVEQRGLKLPPHYAEYRGSMDCKSCPADMTPKRRAYLERHFPEIGRDADKHYAFALDLAEAELARVRAARPADDVGQAA